MKSIILMKMKQKLLAISGALIIILLAIVGVQQYQLFQTKQYSPEAKVQYVSSNLRIDVQYNRPSKNGRVIFGELVPYGNWWRTGANEPTTISLSRDVLFNEKDLLLAGTYSVVTIPHPDHWILIFNMLIPDWGTDYDPSQDVLEVRMQVARLPQTVEQFLIDFADNDDEAQLIMAWDNVKASVPFRVF